MRRDVTRTKSSNMDRRSAPLSGVRVLDLSALAPGPFATMLLGDFGADVITVEPPTRTMRSPLAAVPSHGALEARIAGVNPLYRSRRSMVVDLKTQRGQGIVLDLAKRSHVLVEGFRPGVSERLGLSYRRVSEINPAIVYCSITGYGQYGRLADRAGHDLNYLAESGFLSMTTRGEAAPGIPGNAVADFAAGGLWAAFGIVVALRSAQATGRGTHVDSSMYEGLLGLMQTVPGRTFVGEPEPSWGEGLLTGAMPFYDCYKTSDGRWISVAAVEPKFFVNLVEALGRPELAHAHGDRDRWVELRAALKQVFSGAPLAHWLEVLDGVDTAVAPVRSVAEAFQRAEAEGRVNAAGWVGPLPRMEGWDAELGPVVSQPGAHTREILMENGWTEQEIEGLVDAAVVQEIQSEAE